MNQQAFEEIVSSNKHLNVLINEHKYSVLSTIKKTPEMSEEFVDWISPKYYEAFVAIYNKSISENEGTICAVLRASFLANTETKEKLADFVFSYIEHSTEKLDDFYSVIRADRHDALLGIEHLEQPFNHLTRAIFQHIDTSKIIAKKNEFGEILLACADIMRKFSPRGSTIEFSIYEKITALAKTLDLTQEKQEAIVQHEKRIGKKATWYIIGSVVIAILLLLRLLGRMG